jgi:hypothetical protein
MIEFSHCEKVFVGLGEMIDVEKPIYILNAFIDAISVTSNN